MSTNKEYRVTGGAALKAHLTHLMNGEQEMEKRCFACMNKIDSSHCSHCGNNNSDLHEIPAHHLPPSTILHEQYYIGLAIEENGEGINYIAYDMIEKKRVKIREFFPSAMCSRKEASKSIIIHKGYELQYKSLMNDFTELSKQLINFHSNNCIVKAKYIFTANKTAYTVYQDVAGATLNRYLRDNLGELSWEDAENLFLPLLYTVKQLNSVGITHRGISPETIIITPQNEIRLTGICTSSARAINSEITPELFAGYAAPEQYQKCTSYGEWTDVYSICAVLYRTLTGSMPPNAETRTSDLDLIAPRQLNQLIPPSVSSAIVRGLAYHPEQRTRTIKDLIGDLYTTSSTTIQRPASRDEYYEDMRNSKKRKFRLPVWLIVILITLPILLGVFFLMYNAILGPAPTTSSSDSAYADPASSNTAVSDSQASSDTVSDPASSEPPAESVISKTAVDSFIDRYYDDIIASETYMTIYKFKKVEEYDDIITAGIVIKQTPEPNKIVPQGTEILLTVSKGPRYVEMPAIMDESGVPIPPEVYQKVLVDYGFEVTIEKIDDIETPSGQIVRLSQGEGTRVDKETTKSIIIYVAN